MDLSTQARITIAAPLKDVFDRAVETSEIPNYFKGYGPIPAVVEASIVGGGPVKVGAIRQVRMSDGSVIEEEILSLEPSDYRYQLLRGFRPPFSFLVKTGVSHWRFAEVAGGTEIRWRFSYTLRSVLVAPLAYPVLALFFRKSMERGLEGLRSSFANGAQSARSAA